LGLEALKMRQVVRYGQNPNELQRKDMQEELTNYVESCYDYEELRQLDNVYVTDHQPVAPKYTTENEDEDQEFYDYQRSIEEYNQGGDSSNKIYGAGKSDY
jgi:hypothetical protein